MTSKMVLAGLALALSGGTALADSRGAGEVTAVSVTLIDLDPNDGVTPSISFAASANDYAGPYAYGYVRASTPEEDIYREYTRTGATPTSGVSGSSSTAWSSASSGAAGADGVGFASLSVKGEALSGAGISGVYYATSNAPAAWFTLSANTQVVFTVTASLSGQTTLGGDPDTGFVENGGAVLQLETRGPSADGTTTVYDRQSAAAVAWYLVADDGTVSGESQSWSGQLASSYSNTTGDAVDGRFSAVLSVAGTSVVAAVPEPSSTALILAGLAAVGGIARRRRA
ncbi:PEP-CTERM sorting domain-containing protein [Pelomonas sp. KK5]|uniref:PEP-CTERM sorting domain-containing protein n=1 Tax=Pelomonas sp. KK5 TaxID=1855730 RepID=UPI001E3497F4|nr:PEP-CTERM sorting domain-containing protein [Pelomonas sp. KK5]